MKTILYTLGTIVVLFIFVIALIISSQNNSTIELNYILAKQSLVFSQALAIFFFIGFVLSSLCWWFFLSRAKLACYQEQRKVDKLSKENEFLRIQLKDQ